MTDHTEWTSPHVPAVDALATVLGTTYRKALTLGLSLDLHGITLHPTANGVELRRPGQPGDELPANVVPMRRVQS